MARYCKIKDKECNSICCINRCFMEPKPKLKKENYAANTQRKR